MTQPRAVPITRMSEGTNNPHQGEEKNLFYQRVQVSYSEAQPAADHGAPAFTFSVSALYSHSKGQGNNHGKMKLFSAVTGSTYKSKCTHSPSSSSRYLSLTPHWAHGPAGTPLSHSPRRGHHRHFNRLYFTFVETCTFLQAFLTHSWSFQGCV